jgi:hypothetical protein
MKTPAVKLINPVYNVRSNSWYFPNLEVFTREDGIQGVRAKENLPKGTGIEYHGMKMGKDLYDTIQALHDTLQATKGGDQLKVADYIMENRRNEYIDGNPRYDQNDQGVGGRGLFLAAKVNEPNPGQRANMKGLNYGRGLQRKSVLVAKRPLAKGEELTFHYGTSFLRDYPVGKP